MSKNVLITGATGLIGRRLVKEFSQRGDTIYVLTTNINSAKKQLSSVTNIIDWSEYLSLTGEDLKIIINLAGKNLGEGRWNEEFKKEAYDSRINSTRKIVELIEKMKNRPDVFLSASGSDYYGNRGNEIITEDSAPGDDFMGKLCTAWETEALKAEKSGVRTVIIRTGFVIAKNAPAVNKLSLPFKLFAGGTIGSGRQYMSWIHIDDAAGIYLYAAVNKNVRGPVNATAPNPETMKNFCKKLTKALHRPAIFHIPALAVKIAAGEKSQVILNGRKAMPDKILKAGYKFKFDDSFDAWKDVFK